MKKKLIQLFFLLMFTVCNLHAQSPVVFALDGEVLAKNKVKLQQKNSPLHPAYKQLLKDAKTAMRFGPVSVMEKTNLPPSGNKHDYMSLAPYFWPDPAKADGLPYIRKDGETNPEVKEYKDKEYLPKLCEVVYTLALANYFSKEESYATHAVTLLRGWFLDTATKMNPNLNFGQAIKGQNTGRGAGLIDTRHFVKLIDGINLLKQSGKLPETDYRGLQNWFADFLNWMQTSVVGKEEMNAKNNHGVWYDAQRIAMALFINQQDLAKQVMLNVQIRIDKQMDKDGFFPAELERTISLHYSLFVVEPLLHIAKMAERVQVDLLHYQSANGNSIAKGFNALIPYLTKQKEWTGKQIKPFDFTEATLALAIGAERLRCSTCIDAIKKAEKKNYKKLRVHLLTDNDF